jgi:hypothetical protein
MYDKSFGVTLARMKSGVNVWAALAIRGVLTVFSNISMREREAGRTNVS